MRFSFLVVYVREHTLFQKETADELLKIGIKNVYFKEPKDKFPPVGHELFPPKRNDA